MALARTLAGILYAMWRDGAVYDVSKLRKGRLREGSRISTSDDPRVDPLFSAYGFIDPPANVPRH